MGIIAKRSLANAAWQVEKSSAPAADPCKQIYWERLTALNYDFLQGNSDSIASTALRFTLSVKEVDIVLVGSTNPGHWQRNIAALEAGPLSQAQFRAMRRRWQEKTWWRRFLRGGRLSWRGCV